MEKRKFDRLVKKGLIKFIRSDNAFSENSVFSNFDKTSGEYIFFELVDYSGNVPKGLSIKGKQKYKRLFVRRVYPVLEIN